MGQNGCFLQVSTRGSKKKIENLQRDNDFGLWKVKMQAVLTQDKSIETLVGDTLMIEILTQVEKIKMVDKGTSSIILCLEDKVIQEVTREKYTTSMWEIIE